LLNIPQFSKIARLTTKVNHFGRHGEWKKCLATKILAKVANWRPTDLKRNLPEELSKIG